MIANSMTIKRHPKELLDFIEEMNSKGVYVINSAVFHSGFLVGGDYFDYKLVKPGIAANESLLKWREAFVKTCGQFNVRPAEACAQFAFTVPGVKSIALNTTHANRIQSNLEMIDADIPAQFWQELKDRKLIEVDFISWL